MNPQIAQITRVTRSVSALVLIEVLAQPGIAAAQAMRNVPRISIDEVKALMAKKRVIRLIVTYCA